MTTTPRKTLRERALIAVARWCLGRLATHITLKPGAPVWWPKLGTMRAYDRYWLPGQVVDGWPEGVQAGYLRIGFGRTEGEAFDPPLFDVRFTREMYDMITDGAIAGRKLQDEQIAAVAKARGLA